MVFIRQGHPREFADYLKYCRKLEFEETPNYQHLRKIFRTLYRRHYTYYDYEYDWKNQTVLNERALAKAHTVYDEDEKEHEKIKERERHNHAHAAAKIHHAEELRAYGRDKSFATGRGEDVKSDKSPYERKQHEKTENAVSSKPKHLRRSSRR